jgi:hypothetical protein
VNIARLEQIAAKTSQAANNLTLSQLNPTEICVLETPAFSLSKHFSGGVQISTLLSDSVNN